LSKSGLGNIKQKSKSQGGSELPPQDTPRAFDEGATATSHVFELEAPGPTAPVSASVATIAHRWGSNRGRHAPIPLGSTVELPAYPDYLQIAQSKQTAPQSSLRLFLTEQKLVPSESPTLSIHKPKPRIFDVVSQAAGGVAELPSSEQKSGKTIKAKTKDGSRSIGDAGPSTEKPLKSKAAKEKPHADDTSPPGKAKKGTLTPKTAKTTKTKDVEPKAAKPKSKGLGTSDTPASKSTPSSLIKQDQGVAHTPAAQVTPKGIKTPKTAAPSAGQAKKPMKDGSRGLGDVTAPSSSQKSPKVITLNAYRFSTQCDIIR